jgi:limonene-1,2-epoxide hydrolase
VTGKPEAVVHRLHEAVNNHDLEALVACFDPGYRSEQPAHPNRVFVGNEQVRNNWSRMFAGMSDFHADLSGLAAQGDTVWSEWVWSGHRGDGSIFDARGVIVMGIAHDHIAWARLYMEETEQDSADINVTVKHLTRSSGPS